MKSRGWTILAVVLGVAALGAGGAYWYWYGRPGASSGAPPGLSREEMIRQGYLPYRFAIVDRGALQGQPSTPPVYTAFYRNLTTGRDSMLPKDAGPNQEDDLLNNVPYNDGRPYDGTRG